ncbi:MAG TPA: efflux transporter outer membrane subunit [Vicinamibacterales bacterium]|nr:efflux transporter outer membrane subunit [Vicinamibacterales bacterium]
MLFIGAPLLCAVGACTVGPPYSRPPADLPTTYRGSTTTPAPEQTATSIAEVPALDVFAEDALQRLLKQAFTDNFDVRIAAARVTEAEAALRITRADQFPEVDAQAEAIGQRTGFTTPGARRTIGGTGFGLAAAWQLDFWGRYRRATEAARAELAATEWGRRAVVATLVSDLATAYFTLRTLDDELDVSRRTLDSRRESLRLTQIREQGGATSLVDVRQAEQLVYDASSEIVTLEREIEQQENLISVLIGSNPRSIDRDETALAPLTAEVPEGLPSSLLEQRPDIQEAEQQLIAANAQIGVARAAYFPSIALTGSAGVQSTALTALLSGASTVWTATAALTQPIFTAGRTHAQVAVAEAQREERLLAYQQVIQRAFREVSDALVEYRRRREFRELQTSLVTSARDARRLAEVRYQGGAASYLEVLDADTRLFSAELGVADAQLRERTAFVEIYRALGGGWR